MEQLFQTLEETFKLGDPEVRTWFLVSHNYLPLILCGVYAIFSTVIGPAIMKYRKPFDLRTPMIIFNFVIVAVYTAALSIIFWNLPNLSREEFCFGTPVRRGHLTYRLIRSFWVIYILKYVEFFDTVFFVLRKKQNLISFLHVIHHTIVPLAGWVVLRTERSGLQSIPVLINSFVHVIMYSYYGLAAMGPHVRKYLWWKKYLTQLQMIQFCLVILFVTVITPLTGCPIGHLSYILDIFIAPFFLYLFYGFYKTTFHSKQKSSEINGMSMSNGDVHKEFTNGTLKKLE